MSKKAFILDTNVLLFDPLAFGRLGANDIIIPIVVIEEIDRFKREMSENGRHARQFTRLIDDMRKDGELSKGVKLPNGAMLSVELGGGDMPLPSELQMDKADNKILGLALQLKKESPRRAIHLLTKDANLRIKSDALGIIAEDYEPSNVEPDQLFSGSSTLKVDPSIVDEFYANKRVDLEKQEETILHLLSLRSDGVFAPQAAVLARSLDQGQARSVTPTEKIPTQVPRTLWNQLRDYQKQGVYWLSEQNTSGAILADDMGLGKTVQTLALAQTPTLIVAPTSLLHNWKEEAARFRPDLKVNVYHGSNRQWDANADLTVTSYGVLRADQEEILKNAEAKPWKMMVLDEAHLIRNQETLAAQAAFKIPAAIKIALTGTPVQNKRSDLFSLFQFISPGLFANEGEMKPELVAPFVLRRKKEDVLKELPPKTHLMHEIELKEAERGRYQAVWAAAKAEILQQLSGAGDGKKANPISMFEALLRARQACDHTGLFYEPDWKLTSSKLGYLMQMIEELNEAGHSVLVYSQWTKFLDRIEEEVSPRFDYERLDGSTANRAKVVNAFQNAEGAKVFLLSLHAGGVGLNLTKASHVIFCDPWWNPFVELQAEDRAYRMGQEKPVTIHRLICTETIEEKLLKIQDSKKKIGISALGEEGSNVSFTEADLISLLS